MERAVRELWAESRDLLGLHSLDEAAAAAPRADLPPAPLAFLRDHVSPGRPLIVSAAATRHWPAASLWPTASYLPDALRSTAVSLHLTPDGRADALAPHPQLPGSRCFASAHVRRVDFPTAVHLIRGSDPAAGLVAYAQQQDDCLRGEYAAVAGDVDAHVPWASEALGCLPRGCQPLDRQFLLRHLLPQGPLRQHLRRRLRREAFPPPAPHRAPPPLRPRLPRRPLRCRAGRKWGVEA